MKKSFCAAVFVFTGLASAAEPPASVRVEPAKMTFYVAAASKGTLPGQVRSQLKQLRQAARGGRIVKLRAFTTGDAEVVRTSILQSLRAQALPIVDIVPVGALPAGVQVLLESIVLSRKVENPYGLLFISGQASTAPLESGRTNTPVLPLARKSLASLQSALSGIQPSNMLRISCFTSSLADETDVHQLMSTAFVHAAVSVVQVQRVPSNQEVECEAIPRLADKPAEPVRLVNPAQAAFAQAVIVSAPAVLLTSTQWNTGARAAFAQVKAALEAGGSSLDQVLYAYAYPSNAQMLQKYRDVRWDFLTRSRAPASTNLVFSGSSTADRLGIDVVALTK